MLRFALIFFRHNVASFTIKRYFLLFGSLIVLFFPQLCRAQENDEMPEKGIWSAGIFTTFQSSVSSSMHGDIAQYESSLAGSTTPAQYPFGGNKAYSIGFGLQVDYRFVRSPYSLYLGGYGLGFNAGNGFRNAPGERFTMTILSANCGIEYTFGQTYQHWNFYGRFGLVPSIITSSNRLGGGRNTFFFSDSLRSNTVDSRLGMEIELGERYHFSRMPFGIEASINYTNVNLIGKSYTKPNYSSGALFASPNNSINDGKNPNDPNDNARVIDYFQVRIGGRYYF
jgi:hypothetical protein